MTTIQEHVARYRASDAEYRTSQSVTAQERKREITAALRTQGAVQLADNLALESETLAVADEYRAWHLEENGVATISAEIETEIRMARRAVDELAGAA